MSLLDIIGSIIGLAYIVSEYRADRWFWPLSLLMSVFYAVIYFVQIHDMRVQFCDVGIWYHGVARSHT